MTSTKTQTEALRALYGRPDPDDLARQLRLAIDGLAVQLEAVQPPSPGELEDFASALSAASRLAAKLADALRREAD